MKLVNLQEEIPEEFYIFQDYGKNIFDQINEHNYSLNKIIVSSGFKNLLITKNFQEYLNGDIDYLPFIKNINYTNTPSAFMFKIINEYNIEHNLEFLRSKSFRKYPSRFSSIFAFGDYESCRQVSLKYNWDLNSVRRFRLLRECNDLNKCIRIGKFNMEIVSLLRGIDIASFDIADQENIYQRYWNGEGDICINILVGIKNNTRENLHSGVIYEYLIEGILKEIF